MAIQMSKRGANDFDKAAVSMTKETMIRKSQWFLAVKEQSAPGAVKVWNLILLPEHLGNKCLIQMFTWHKFQKESFHRFCASSSLTSAVEPESKRSWMAGAGAKNF